MSRHSVVTATRDGIEELCGAMRQYIARHFELNDAVQVLLSCRHAEIAITGSSVRSALLAPERFTDLDLIVRDPENEITSLFERLELRSTRTYLGDHRYFWGPMQIDVIALETSESFRDALNRHLHTFDLGINAVAYKLGREEVFDPLGGISLLHQKRVGLNMPAWRNASPAALANQCWRLARILHEWDGFKLTKNERNSLEREFLPCLQKNDWSAAKQKYPPGKAAFIERFRSVLTRSTA